MRNLLLATAALALSAPASAITFVNSLAVPNGTDLSGLPTGVNSNRFGGFGSDLFYDAATNSYFGLTDRGPGGGTIDYAPRFHNFSVAAAPATGWISNFTLNQTIIFKQADGTPFSGLNSQLLGDSSKLGKSFDPEGLTRRANGNFLVSDEYGPSVYEFDPSGKFIRAFNTPANLLPLAGATPDFTSGRPTITTGRQDNRGFEGLTLSSDGKTAYAILQDPLVNEGGTGDGRRSRNLRIVAYDVATGNSTGQYIYQLEDLADINGRIPGDADDFSAANQGRSIGVSSITALPNGQFLIIERDNRGLGVEDPDGSAPVGSKRVYLIDLAGATDVSDVSLADTSTLPTGVTPVSKLLFLDVQGALQAAGAVIPEKLEGLSFGPWLDDGSLSFLLVSDSDFSVTQNSGGLQFDVCTSGVGGVSSQVGLDAGCSAGQSLIPSYVLGFKLSGAEASALGFSNPAVPEPATWATMIAGFLMAGSAIRRRRRNLPHATA